MHAENSEHDELYKIQRDINQALSNPETHMIFIRIFNKFNFQFLKGGRIIINNLRKSGAQNVWLQCEQVFEISKNRIYFRSLLFENIVSESTHSMRKNYYII